MDGFACKTEGIQLGLYLGRTDGYVKIFTDFASLANEQLQYLKQATIIYSQSFYLLATGINKTFIHLEVHNYMQCYVGG